jgi:hypothetical protein
MVVVFGLGRVLKSSSHACEGTAAAPVLLGQLITLTIPHIKPAAA